MGKKRKKKNVILNIFIAAAFLAGAGIFSIQHSAICGISTEMPC